MARFIGRPGRSFALLATVVLVVAARAAAADRQAPSRGKSAAELAADVARTTREYRAALERALPAYESELAAATEALDERRSLYRAGVLSASYVEEAERAWQEARKNLLDAREDMELADRIILEASLQAQLARLAPLPRGAFQETATLVRFNGTTPWSVADVPKLEQVFASAFGRSLPISAFGQTRVHDRLGLDHRHAIDVAVHPDSAEGQWLMQYLRRSGIPFIGVRGAVPGAATGAHVHVGAASSRLGAR